MGRVARKSKRKREKGSWERGEGHFGGMKERDKERSEEGGILKG